MFPSVSASPCFFSLLKYVLRAIPSSRAARALFPALRSSASIKARRSASGSSSRLATDTARNADSPRDDDPRSADDPGDCRSTGKSDTVMVSPSASTTARSITFCSSRMLPGQEYLSSRSVASSSNFVMRRPARDPARGTAQCPLSGACCGAWRTCMTFPATAARACAAAHSTGCGRAAYALGVASMKRRKSRMKCA